MNHSTQMTYRNMKPSTEVGVRVVRAVEQMRRACPAVVRCDVVIEQTRRQDSNVPAWRVRVDVLVPGGWLIAREDPVTGPDDADLAGAVHDAFEDAHDRLLRSLGRGYRGSRRNLLTDPPALRFSPAVPPPSTRWIPTGP